MPIRPENRWLYPIDWSQLSQVIRFDRARARCERCGRPHRHFVAHLGDGRWWDGAARRWRCGRGRPILIGQFAMADVRTTYVVLACAHLDHDPGNNALANLAALCQRCHIMHDAAEHRWQRWWNVFRQRAIRDLFEDPRFTRRRLARLVAPNGSMTQHVLPLPKKKRRTPPPDLRPIGGDRLIMTGDPLGSGGIPSVIGDKVYAIFLK